MPELPEAETIARTLEPSLIGRSLVGITVLNPGTWQSAIRPEEICLKPRPLLGTGRRGKLVLVKFADELQDAGRGGRSAAQTEAGAYVFGLAFHLKMTGRLFPYPAGKEPEPHTRLILDLDDGSRVFFDDCRKFGYVRALSVQELAGWEFWQKLGPEPLEISPAEFAERLHGAGSIKARLLDQHNIAGIGNIYADESLFRAGIAPTAKYVEKERLTVLCEILKEVLRESIRECGSSIRDYRTASGDAGAFQNSFRVYGRTGKPCENCGTVLEKCTVAGRTTVFCPKCQK